MTVESVEQKIRGTRWVVPALLALILVLGLASLAIGPAAIPLWTAAKALVSGEGSAGVIVRDIRLPRTLLAILIGGTLGATGAALQGLLRNPLADSSVFGAPQAAALGAVLVLYFGLAGALSFALPLAAILGALVSIALVVAVAGRDGSTVVLVLAGLAIGSLAGAATSLAISLSPNPFAITEIVFWLLGSLEDRSMVHVVLAAPFLAIATALLLTTGRALRALSLGEETAGASASTLRGRGSSSSARAPSGPGRRSRSPARSASSGSWRRISCGRSAATTRPGPSCRRRLRARPCCLPPIARCGSSPPAPRSGSAS